MDIGHKFSQITAICLVSIKITRKTNNGRIRTTYESDRIGWDNLLAERGGLKESTLLKGSHDGISCEITKLM